MQFAFLADHPTAVPLIARWYFEEWGHVIPGDSLEATVERVRGMLGRDAVPLHVVGLEAGRVVAVAQLKFREMAIYPEKEHWLGGVYVAPEARGRGLASQLCRNMADRARSLGIRTLHLQTESTATGGLYGRLGWESVERVNYHGVDVLVMARDLGEGTPG